MEEDRQRMPAPEEEGQEDDDNEDAAHSATAALQECTKLDAERCRVARELQVQLPPCSPLSPPSSAWTTTPLFLPPPSN